MIQARSRTGVGRGATGKVKAQPRTPAQIAAAAAAVAAAAEKRKRDAFDIAVSLGLRASQGEYGMEGFSLPINLLSPLVIKNADMAFVSMATGHGTVPEMVGIYTYIRAMQEGIDEIYWKLSYTLAKKMGITGIAGADSIAGARPNRGFSLQEGRVTTIGSKEIDIADNAFVAKVKDIMKIKEEDNDLGLILGNSEEISKAFGPAAAATETALKEHEDRLAAQAARVAAAVAAQKKYEEDVYAWEQKALADASLGITPAEVPPMPQGVFMLGSLRKRIESVTTRIKDILAAGAADPYAAAAAAPPDAAVPPPSMFGGRKSQRISRKKRARRNKTKGRK